MRRRFTRRGHDQWVTSGDSKAEQVNGTNQVHAEAGTPARIRSFVNGDKSLCVVMSPSHLWIS